MTRKRRPQGDPIEYEIELALNPGVFIPYGASFSFVSEFEEIAAKIAKLVSSDPARAVTLYETFLAACYLKIEELDDSSGSFGPFVDEVYCGWIKGPGQKYFAGLGVKLSLDSDATIERNRRRIRDTLRISRLRRVRRV